MLNKHTELFYSIQYEYEYFLLYDLPFYIFRDKSAEETDPNKIMHKCIMNHCSEIKGSSHK